MYRRGSKGIYYARYERNGKETWKSLKTKTRSVAQTKLAELEAKQAHSPQAKTANAKTPALAVLVAKCLLKWEKRREYKSFGDIKGRLNVIANSSLGRLLVTRITSEQIENFLLNLTNQHRKSDASAKPVPVSNGTRNRYLVELNKIFKEAKAWRVDNPCDEVQRFPERNQERIAPTSEEIAAVLEPLRDGRIRPHGKKAADFIEFLSLSGCRLAEAGEIVWERVFFDHGYILVRGKAKQDRAYKERKIPLFPGLSRLLERMRQELSIAKGPVFPGTGKLNYHPKRALESAIKAAGLPPERRFTFHGLRHYFATEAVVRGVVFPAVAAWLGHSDNGILVAARYGNHVTDDQVAHYIERMDFAQAATKQNDSWSDKLLQPFQHAADPNQSLCLLVTRDRDLQQAESIIKNGQGRELSRQAKDDLIALYFENIG